MGWVKITDEAPPNRGYAPGEVVDLGSNAAIWKGRGWAVPASPPVETATRGAPENAARRPSRPEPRYVGHGWWEIPGRDAKVRAPKDADPDQVLEEAE